MIKSPEWHHWNRTVSSTLTTDYQVVLCWAQCQVGIIGMKTMIIQDFRTPVSSFGQYLNNLENFTNNGHILYMQGCLKYPFHAVSHHAQQAHSGEFLTCDARSRLSSYMDWETRLTNDSCAAFFFNRRSILGHWGPYIWLAGTEYEDDSILWIAALVLTPPRRARKKKFAVE